MKKSVTFIIIIILVLNINMFSQNKDYFSNKHEFSIQTSEIFNNNFVNNNWYYPEILMCSSCYYPYPYYNFNIDNKPLLGIAYKYHFKNSAIRFMTSGKYKSSDENTSFEYNPDNFNTTNQFYFVNSSYIGYELNKSFNRTQLYYGLDVGFKYVKYKYENQGEYSSIDVDGNEVKSTYTEEYKYQDNSFRITPFVGVRYFFTPHFSISTESKILLEYVDSKSNRYYKNSYGSEVWENNENSKKQDKNFGFMPFGNISLNIHF